MIRNSKEVEKEIALIEKKLVTEEQIIKRRREKIKKQYKDKGIKPTEEQIKKDLEYIERCLKAQICK